MEALAELEKQMEGCLPPKSRYEEFNLVDDLKEQVRFLQKEKQVSIYLFIHSFGKFLRRIVQSINAFLILSHCNFYCQGYFI